MTEQAIEPRAIYGALSDTPTSYVREDEDAHPPLDYPPALRHAGLQGRVTVQAVIDTLGRAEPASLKVIMHPNTAFDQSARAYVLQAVFRPARVKGRAVRVLISVPVDYRIE